MTVVAIVLDGVVFGLQLAVLGVGLSLVFGLSGVLDLAYGARIAAGAVLGVMAVEVGGLHGWSATVMSSAVVVATVTALGMLVDRTVLLPVYRRTGEERVVLSLLVTLAVAFVVDGVLVGARPHAALTLTVAGGPLEVIGVPMRRGSLVAAAVAATALALAFVLLHATRLGRAIRCVIQDEEGAQLCGIEPARVRLAVVLVSGILGGVVGVTQALRSSVTPTDGFDLTVLAIIVAVVGGLGRVAGAVVAGLVLGVVHAVATATVGASGTWVVLLTAAAITIVVRPEGVLGLVARTRRTIDREVRS
jgi:branched-chain amino acid transport system permease protein